MRWSGPLYGLNIMSKNGRDDIILTQTQDFRHMLQSEKMFGRDSERKLKKGLESI